VRLWVLVFIERRIIMKYVEFYYFTKEYEKRDINRDIVDTIIYLVPMFQEWQQTFKQKQPSKPNYDTAPRWKIDKYFYDLRNYEERLVKSINSFLDKP
jgi:hypothetical protein